MWFGANGGVSRFDGRVWTTFTTEDGLAYNSVESIVQGNGQQMWMGTFGGVSVYEANAFATFDVEDGLASNNVLSVLHDREGSLWLGTYGSGVSHYDCGTFKTFTSKDGLADDLVFPVFVDSEGNLWVGTNRRGASRYDGNTFTNYTTEDGLPRNSIRSFFEDNAGDLWIGSNGGVSRYNGQTFTTYTTEDGLGSNSVYSMAQDREGRVWFSTYGGVSCYDGQVFRTYTTQDGLVHNVVWSILEDDRGRLWFGTDGGVSCYDGQSWTAYTTKDGLAHNRVTSVFQDASGEFWFGTEAGLSRFDGHTWKTYTTENGLGHNSVMFSIVQDQSGVLWFPTEGGGVSSYDGRVFQTLARQDGLGSNTVHSIAMDKSGLLWFGTAAGVTRYRPPAPATPGVTIEGVVADKRHAGVDTLSIPSAVDLLSFEFTGFSLKTRSDGMLYRYRLLGLDPEWRTTRQRRVEYGNLDIGDYTFEVVAVNRDLAYSESPAVVHVTIHPPYGTIALAVGLGLALTSTVIASGVAMRRRRDLRRAEQTRMREMAKELQTAHDMQMALMPTAPPQVEGFDIAGRCIPANHVGGDFYQYFVQGDKLSLCLADVTGAAMEAAIPVVMFNGILDKQMELGGNVEAAFDGLNRTLHRTLDSRTFVCFTMAEIAPTGRSYRLSNAGCPYPYHFSAETGQVTELQLSAYPLGVRAETEYSVFEGQLQAGDRLVFCSDGIVEAENDQGEQFGYDRMLQTVLAVCEADLPAEGTIDRILARVRAFSGDVPQADDMTCVVVKVEG